MGGGGVAGVYISYTCAEGIISIFSEPLPHFWNDFDIKIFGTIKNIRIFLRMAGHKTRSCFLAIPQKHVIGEVAIKKNIT